MNAFTLSLSLSPYCSQWSRISLSDLSSREKSLAVGLVPSEGWEPEGGARGELSLLQDVQRYLLPSWQRQGHPGSTCSAAPAQPGAER